MRFKLIKHILPQVSPPFIFGPNVQPIKLPSQGDEPPAEGSAAIVIGWGHTDIPTTALNLKS